ncbi:hypothetical protein REPUB_Repub14bG0012900 [Reevesia pubescens]
MNTFEDVFRVPNLVNLNSIVKKRSRASNWVALPHGFLKFNVDGSTLGKPRTTGIGGFLRNEDKNVKIVLSKCTGISDSNNVKFLAIQKAFVIFMAFKWSKIHDLLIKSDSLNVVKWIKHPHSTL